MRWPAAPALLLVALVALMGCGGSSKHSSTTASAPSTTASAPSTTGSANGAGAGQGTAGTSPSSTSGSSQLGRKPKVPKPSGSPPSQLVARDLVRGSGPVAHPGSAVTVHYVGVLFRTGRQFDASWDRGQPFTFQLGAGQVIPGWDQGVAGMHVGGRRELIIPPSLGYGAQGSPPAIGPNEPLVFVIDLLAVH